jgi:Protein of unknown function (DUF998)
MAAALRISAVSLGLFAGALVAEHAVESSLSVVHTTISEYARTDSGFLIRFGFAAWAVSFSGLVLVTWRHRLRAEAVGLGVAACGVVLVCAFNTQAVQAQVPSDVARTLGGRLHDFGGEMVIGGVLLAVVAGAVRGPWSRRSRALLCLTFATSAAFLLAGDPAPGLRQRALVVYTITWQALALHYFFSKQRRFSMQYQLMPEQRPPSQPENGRSAGTTSSMSRRLTRSVSRAKSCRSAVPSREAAETNFTPSTDTS